MVNLAQGGAITEVPVTTGLTEGSYIQITGGLAARADGDRQVNR